MEENLPPPQVPVNPVPVPPVQLPPPKRFPLKWTIIIALLAGIILAGSYLIFKSQSVKQIPVQVPIQTCRPRPACLDAKPVICLIVETDDMCPPAEGKFCGGIANIECPSDYKCQLDGSYPDAGGKCVKE